MSGDLFVRLITTASEGDLAGGVQVVGNIFSTEAGGMALRDVLLPAGPAVAPSCFSVAAGRYVIEATLPSGAQVSDEVEVAEGGTASVDLDATDSPHETHAWQYLSGNIESGSLYHTHSDIVVPQSIGSRYFGFKGLAGETVDDGLTLAQLSNNPVVTWVPDSRSSSWSFEELNALVLQSSAAGVSAGATRISEGPLIPVPVPSVTDGMSHLFRFNRDGPIPPTVWPSPGYEGVPPELALSRPANVLRGARQFLIIESSEDAYLVTLPSPWTDVRRGDDIQIEVLVNARQSRSGSPVAVTVRDPTIGTGLAYLANGALTSAATVFVNVEEMLYGKVTNSLAAAAAAYVLVGTEQDGREQDNAPRPWHYWLENLRNWFGWMSDGSILWAAKTLRHAQTNEEVSQGRAALLEGYERGVPFYTLGLSWLIDGLSEFPDDDECATKLEQVRRLSWRVDMRQPFVIVRLGGEQ
jgi:hypothetical protein